jgi:uncharacterized DUF497 family protein
VYTENVAVVWDPEKLKTNIEKHGIRFPDAIPALEDPLAVTVTDYESDPAEERFITLGSDASGRIWWWSTLGAAATSG